MIPFMIQRVSRGLQKHGRGHGPLASSYITEKKASPFPMDIVLICFFVLSLFFETVLQCSWGWSWTCSPFTSTSPVLDSRHSPPHLTVLDILPWVFSYVFRTRFYFKFFHLCVEIQLHIFPVLFLPRCSFKSSLIRWDCFSSSTTWNCSTRCKMNLWGAMRSLQTGLSMWLFLSCTFS